jgi:predicted CoA-substrate-specific enzyme activase
MSGHALINKQLDWKKAGVIAAGVDIGAVTSKALILLDGQPYASSQVATRTLKESAFDAVNGALDKTGLKLKDIHSIVATGRGSTQAAFAHKTVSEIACGAAGAVRVWGPSVRTVLDAGGQSCKVIHCTEKGRVTSFLWNDKCAAGIGRSIEAFGELVRKDLAEMADIALRFNKFPRLGDFCSVYAQSEALDLIRSKVPVEELIAGYHYAMARRISTLVDRAGVKKDLVIIGGLARNPGIVNQVESILKVSRMAPEPAWDPALIPALGAALYADGFYKRHRD